jgi:phosphoadenosine phosphosulfate reductase
MPVQDGLDLDQLRGLRRLSRYPGKILDRIAHHLAEYEGYVAFSGGKDSLVTLDLARRVDPDVPIAFFDSGLEYPETYTYIAELADSWNLDLHIYPARPGLLTVLAGSGEWDHDRASCTVDRSLRDLVIDEPAARAHADHGAGELWGVRADESRRGTGRWALYYSTLARDVQQHCLGCCITVAEQRTTHGGTFTRRTDGTRVYGPIWDWDSDEVWAHIARRRLPVNPVYATLRRLGCDTTQLRVAPILDGSFLERGRITRLRRGWPALFEELAQVLPRIREVV